jgi:hypothetical protein
MKNLLNKLFLETSMTECEKLLLGLHQKYGNSLSPNKLWEDWVEILSLFMTF